MTGIVRSGAMRPGTLFVDLTWRTGLTTDFSALVSITNMEQLSDLRWLPQAGRYWAYAAWM